MNEILPLTKRNKKWSVSKIHNRILSKKARAFTLIEMLVVLAIISILVLLFVPNLSKEKDKVKNTGESAVVKVVESQAELYELDHGGKASLSELVKNEMISQKQADSYKSYYAKNKNENRGIGD